MRRASGPCTAPASSPEHAPRLLLCIGLPAGVDVHHAPYHTQAQAQVPGHGAGLTVLVGVLLQRRGVDRGICRAGRVGSESGLSRPPPSTQPRGPTEGQLVRPQENTSCLCLHPDPGAATRWQVGRGRQDEEPGTGGSHLQIQGCRGPVHKSASPEASQPAAAGTGGW